MKNNKIIKRRNNTVKSKWLRINEHSNALNYLKMLNYFVLNVNDNPFYWKWVIISLHGAMYSFAVSAIRGTNVESVVHSTKRGERLISFDEALKRCQDTNWMRYALLNDVLTLSESQENSVRKMKDLLRNEFMHFKPKEWSIELHYFITITLDCLEITRFLGIQAYSGYRYNLNKQRIVRSLVFQTIKFVKGLDLYKEIKIVKGKSNP